MREGNTWAAAGGPFLSFPFQPGGAEVGGRRSPARRGGRPFRAGQGRSARVLQLAPSSFHLLIVQHSRLGAASAFYRLRNSWLLPFGFPPPPGRPGRSSSPLHFLPPSLSLLGPEQPGSLSLHCFGVAGLRVGALPGPGTWTLAGSRGASSSSCCCSSCRW